MVVLTSAHPSSMGNINFFAEKPVLFDVMEYIGRNAVPTELKDVSHFNFNFNSFNSHKTASKAFTLSLITSQ